MAKKSNIPDAVYGTRISHKGIRSNHPIRSRYMAAVLAIILGVIGANQFYLRNIARGVLKIIFTAVCVIIGVFMNAPLILIPVILSVLTGIMYLCRSDESFRKRNHVRTI